MNLNFALLIFCLTIITIIAIVYGKDDLALKIAEILNNISSKAFQAVEKVSRKK